MNRYVRFAISFVVGAWLTLLALDLAEVAAALL
jgi:hypothetical protein